VRRTLGTIKMWDEKTAFGQMMIGDDFARAARHLVELYESDYSTAFCLCHALEMYLKSYLLLKGEAARSLLRHDLNNLLSRAIDLGLLLQPDDMRIIRELAPFAKDYVFRYGSPPAHPEGKPMTEIEMPHPTDIIEAMGRLAKAVGPSVSASR
jgi:HEPN domain-containing protein